jgi:hypothetical protein
MPQESPQATRAYADYVSLGPDRSLDALIGRYRSGTIPAQTRRLSTLKQWSILYRWQGRLQALADAARAEAEARQAAEVRAVMEAGYALTHERVRVLKRLGETLADELQGERLWLRDRKSIKVGSTAITSDDGARVIGQEPQYEVFDLERPNAAWVEQLRGLLDDIAQETGGRIRRTELSGKDGGAIVVERVVFTDDDDPAAV